MPEELIVPISQLTEVGKKTEGFGAGYIAKDGSEAQYMVKTAHKENDNEFPDEMTKAAYKRDVTSEFLVGGVFSRLLGPSSPIIGLAYDNDHIYLTSRYIEGFQSMKDYVSDQSLTSHDSYEDIFGPLNSEDQNAFTNAPGTIGSSSSSGESSQLESFSGSFGSFSKSSKLGLAEIEGFEKVVVASLFAGDPDYHSDNLGIVVDPNGSHVVKIDHGRAGFGFTKYPDAKSLMKRLYIFRGDEKNGLTNIALNHCKFKAALDQACSISEREIRNSIHQRCEALESNGVMLNSQYYDVDLGSKIIPNADELKEDQVALTKISEEEIHIQVKGKTPLVLIKKDDKVMCGQKVIPIIWEDLSKLPELGSKSKNSLDSRDALLTFTSEIGYTKNENKLRYQKLEEFYVAGFEKRKLIFEDISNTLDIVTKIDADEKFKNGGWLDVFVSDEKTPKELATELLKEKRAKGISAFRASPSSIAYYEVKEPLSPPITPKQGGKTKSKGISCS